MQEANTNFGDIIDAGPVPFSFDAPGWTFLTILILILIAAYVVYRIHIYRKNKFRRDALEYLVSRQEKNQSSGIIYEANILMKRLALRQGVERAAARLTGEEWLDFLNRHCSKVSFDTQDSQLILSASYRTEDIAPEQIEGHISKVKLWIKYHRL